MYSCFLSADAKEDLKRIYFYRVGRFGIDQADKYFNMIHDCFSKIEENPFLFPSAEHIKLGYRYCVCGVDTIYYRIVNDERIEIISIIGRQNFRENIL